MNIFFLDKDPSVCAKYHCDKHVCKMIVETGQMLSTAYQRNFGKVKSLYKPAYENHPMTKWVGNTKGNFQFTVKLFHHLLVEYFLRYGKEHKTKRIAILLEYKHTKWKDKLFGIMSRPPLCMPDQYKKGNYVESYRRYYIAEKKRFAKYNYSETPYWLGGNNAG